MSNSGKSLPDFRLAQVEDAAEITRLAAELGYPASVQDMASRLATLLPLPEHFVVVAESGGALLGWAAVEIRMQLVSGRKAELMGLVVDANARRMGIGKALVRATENWVREQGFDKMTVRSSAARPESHPFYERLGYERSKTQHVYIKHFDDV
ncbi:MAG: GNAT family N-acetyltransferase [Acidimicrobiales bacterium]